MPNEKADPKDVPEKKDESLSEDDLDAVSGGFNPQPDPPGRSIRPSTQT